MQVNSGLNHLFGVESSPNVQVMVITVITALATISVVSGLDKGIKILSEFNILGRRSGSLVYISSGTYGDYS